MIFLLREAPGHGVEEPLFDLSHDNIFNPREILRLRSRARTNRGNSKDARELRSQEQDDGGAKYEADGGK